MENRKLRVIFTKGGSGSVTTKVSLPKTWIDKMGIDELLREINVSFDGEKIIIEKFKSGDTLEGKRWGELSEKQQKDLLENPYVVNGTCTFNYSEPGAEKTMNHNGPGSIQIDSDDYIIDLTENLSIEGKVIDGEIIINDNSILYNPNR